MSNRYFNSEQDREYLFVYGSLAPRAKNAHFLKRLRGSWSKFQMAGRLFKLIRSEDAGYPGLVLTNSSCVTGYLFSSKQLRFIWAKLDAFEGENYRRVRTTISLNGNPIQVWVYELSERGLRNAAPSPFIQR